MDASDIAPDALPARPGLVTGDALPVVLHDAARQRAHDRYALDVTGRSWTYGQLEVLVQDWMRALAGAGVGSGDRLVVLLPGCCEAIAIWMAAARLGAVEVAINTAYVGQILADVVSDSSPALVMVDERFAQAADELEAAGAVPVLRVRLGAGDGRAAAELPRADAVDRVGEIDEATIATVIFTSGTTGRSKGVLVPWGQLHETAVWSWPFEDLESSDRWYSPWPIFHVSGKLGPYTAALVGGTVVFKERFRASEFWSDVRRHGVTTTVLPGSAAAYLASAVAGDEADTPLRNVYVAPMPEDPEEFQRRFAVRLCTAFNMTELPTPIVSSWWPRSPATSCGRVRPGVECAVVDEHDEQLGPGVPGELVVRSVRPWRMMSGYLNRDDATVEAWRNQWFHTGDRFVYDEDGFFYYTGRIKDSIRRRGENISAYEVERVIDALPEVVESAVIGVPSGLGDEELHAFLVAEPGLDARLDPKEAWEQLSTRLPRFMVPRFVSVVDELPKTTTQRVDKQRLRETATGLCPWDSTTHPDQQEETNK